MFNLASLLGLVSNAPGIIFSGITLIEELDAGYQEAKATPGANLLTYVEDMMQQLVANKGAVASAIMGPEPVVSAAGAVLHAATAVAAPAAA